MKHHRLLWLAVLVGLAVVPGTPARAETASAKPAAEAWYATPLTCTTPLGCAAVQALPPVGRYPAGTLHVGVTGGLEDARSYVRLDLGQLPSDAVVSSGSLVIPVLGPDAGSVAPETAQVVACLTTSMVSDSEGTSGGAPTADCTVRAPATYAAGSPATLTIDLAPFAARWAAGEANHGVALVPAPDTTPGSTWHVAFAKGTAAAALDYTPAVAAPEPTVEPEPAFGDSGFSALPVDVPFVAAPPLASAAPIRAQADQPARLAPVVAFGGPGFAYPVVFVIPLLLVGLGGYLAWALTRPVVVVAR